MVIEDLKHDHRCIEEIFRRIDTAREPAERESLLAELATELESHATIEESVVYPRALELADTEALARHSEAEHNEVRDLVAQALSLSPKAPEWVALVEQVRDNVPQHVRIEESVLFPALERQLSEAQLAAIADEIAAAREGYALAG